MKSFLILLCLSQVANAKIPQPHNVGVTHSVCNQQVYDNIYQTIVKASLATKLTQHDIDEKNYAIETLRQLCEGQLSTFETGVRR